MTELKPGKKILYENNPYEILKYDHHAMGRGSSVVNVEMKNLLTGNNLSTTFRSSDKLEEADITYSNSEYLYFDGSSYCFMNTDTYDQFEISAEVVGENRYFLTEGDKVMLQEFGGNPINIQVEPSVFLEIEETPPGEKGDTATGGKKPATTTTGFTLQVPLFLKPGDKIRVDTRTKEYLSRG